MSSTPSPSSTRPITGKSEGIGRGREQLVVLAEADVVELRALGERDALELDHEADAGALRDVAGVSREPVREVEHRGRHPSEALSLLDAVRHRRQRAVAERDSGGAERPGQDDDVPGLRARAARHAVRAAERGHGQDDAVGARRVAAAHRHAALVQAGVELEHVLELGLRREPERDEESERIGSRGGEVADVDGRGPRAELAPAQEVEAEVDALDEHVLRDDEAVDDRGVVLDPLREPPPLELGEQPELADLPERGHDSEMRARPSSVSGSSAASAS